MDRPAMTHAMKDSISEVLEQMFFLPIDLMASVEPASATLGNREIMAASVGFNGSLSGHFTLALPNSLAATVTADFMGVEPQTLTNEQVTGTVKEMINMLAGNTLSAYAPQTVFDLQIPEMCTSIPENDTAVEKAHQIGIDVQTLESRMTIQLMIKDA